MKYEISEAFTIIWKLAINKNLYDHIIESPIYESNNVYIYNVGNLEI